MTTATTITPPITEQTQSYKKAIAIAAIKRILRENTYINEWLPAFKNQLERYEGDSESTLNLTIRFIAGKLYESPADEDKACAGEATILMGDLAKAIDSYKEGDKWGLGRLKEWWAMVNEASNNIEILQPPARLPHPEDIGLGTEPNM